MTDLFSENEKEYSLESGRMYEGGYSSLYSDVEGGGYGGCDDDEMKGNEGCVYDEDEAEESFEDDGTIPGYVGGSNGNAGRILKKIGLCALMILLCFAAGFGGGRLAVKDVQQTPAAQTPSGTSSGEIKISGDKDSLNAASAVAQKTMPSVVGISTETQTLTETLYGLQSGTSTGIGTGIIVSKDGYVLTNSHVINDGDTKNITVDLYDGSEYDGKVLWNDASLDLAIVKIEAEGLTAAELGDSSDVTIGDYALAIGNPMGLDFERSVTSGIISGLNRSITVENSDGSRNVMDGLIQTDASINSGNSGGPLINSEGKVIGINSAKASSAEGLGFAIPINVAVPVISQVMENGSFESGYLGISGIDLANITVDKEDTFTAKKGVYVYEVIENTGAEEAGLKSGDIITAINDLEVDSMNSLKKILISCAPGDTVKVTYERDKKSGDVSVVLGDSSSIQKESGSDTEERDDEPDTNGGIPVPEEGGRPEPEEDGGLGDLFDDFFGSWW